MYKMEDYRFGANVYKIAWFILGNILRSNLHLFTAAVDRQILKQHFSWGLEISGIAG